MRAVALEIYSIPFVEDCETEAINLYLEAAFENANELLALVSIKAFAAGAGGQCPFLAIHHSWSRCQF